jgi:hypothetical protein
MDRRIVAIVAVLGVMFAASGCYVKRSTTAPAASVPQPKNETIVGITTVAGESVIFDAPGATISNSTLHAFVKKAAYELPLDQVQRFWIERKELSKSRTIGLVAAVTTVVVLLAVGVSREHTVSAPSTIPNYPSGSIGSCPLVYSWNGTEYVFDAEPYGGAITRGLEKDDYSRLEHLRAEGDSYRLKVSNETDETQITNLTELWVVDHPKGTEVAPDARGNLHLLTGPQALLSARDGQGHDLSHWLGRTDGLIWEPAAVANSDGSLRNEIVMSFPKPLDATHVNLVANVATGFWGSYMIRRIVELHGRDVGAWYASLDENQAARDAITAWDLREQLYALKIYVEEPTGWEVRGVLPGIGPYISKDQVIPLDVSRVRGSQLRIRILPSVGFWALNSFAVDYSSDQAVTMKKIAPITARDSHGKNVLPELLASDDHYQTMPNVGDSVDLTFPAPPPSAGTDRAIFLHSRGYYQLHLAEEGESARALLQEIENVPGAAVRFAVQQFSAMSAAAKTGER